MLQCGCFLPSTRQQLLIIARNQRKMKNFIKPILFVAALACSQLSFSQTSPLTGKYQGMKPIVIKKYKLLAKAPIGTTISCSGDYFIRNDSIDVTIVSCVYRGDKDILNYVSYGTFGLNGWDIVSQQITPGLSTAVPIISVVFKKSVITKTYTDPDMGEFPGKL